MVKIKKKLYTSMSVQNVAVTLIAKGFAEEIFLLAYRNESVELFFFIKLLFKFIFAIKVN